MAFATNQAQPQQSPYDTSTAYNPKQGQPFGAWAPQQAYDPNIANNPQANRPPAFQSQSYNFDGTQSQMPNYQQQGAFISQINNQLGQMQGQSWNQQMGAPQFDFGQMWGQAGNMVQQGWQNPFAQQQVGQPSPQNERPATPAVLLPDPGQAQPIQGPYAGASPTWRGAPSVPGSKPIDPASVRSGAFGSQASEQESEKKIRALNLKIGEAQEVLKTLPKKNRYGDYDQPLTAKQQQAINFLKDTESRRKSRKRRAATADASWRSEQQALNSGMAAWLRDSSGMSFRARPY